MKTLKIWPIWIVYVIVILIGYFTKTMRPGFVAYLAYFCIFISVLVYLFNKKKVKKANKGKISKANKGKISIEGKVFTTILFLFIGFFVDGLIGFLIVLGLLIIVFWYDYYKLKKKTGVENGRIMPRT